MFIRNTTCALIGCKREDKYTEKNTHHYKCVVAFCLNKVSAGSKKKEKKIRLNAIQNIIATEREVYTHVQGFEDEMR